MSDIYKGPIPALDLRLQAFDRTVRGIRVVGSWWLDQNGVKMPRPCLVLLHPFRRIIAGRIVPVVIHLDDAWKWAPDTPDPVAIETPREGGPLWASRTIRGWLEDGLLPGNPMNPTDRLAIMDAIVDSLRDLIHMPPLPPRRSRLIMGSIEVVDSSSGCILDSVEISQ